MPCLNYPNNPHRKVNPSIFHVNLGLRFLHIITTRTMHQQSRRRNSSTEVPFDEEGERRDEGGGEEIAVGDEDSHVHAIV